MKKITLSILLWITCHVVHAYTPTELPDTFYITQHWISYTTSFSLDTDTEHVGTLYRNVLRLPVSYSFYDAMNSHLATARSRLPTLRTYFDITDHADHPLGHVQEKSLTFFPSFTLYQEDGKKLAHADLNFFGTQFTITDVTSGQEIAVMTRPFFRLRNSWTVNITNPELFKTRHINPTLFMTVLAFQVDSEYWKQQDHDKHNRVMKASGTHTPQGAALKAAQDKITALMQVIDIHDTPFENPAVLEKTATQLEVAYTHSEGTRHEENMDDTAKFNAFIHFCVSKIEASTTSTEEKQAILFLLQQRLFKWPLENKTKLD